MNKSSRKSNNPLSERRVIDMNDRKIKSCVWVETKRQAEWLHGLKPDSTVYIFDHVAKKFAVIYYEES